MTTGVARWGNSLAVRIPRALAEQVNLAEGDTVRLEAGQGGSLIIRPERPRYSLRDLVGRISSLNRHRETTWGRAAGHETW
jgi:antitoxin MazE